MGAGLVIPAPEPVVWVVHSRNGITAHAWPITPTPEHPAKDTQWPPNT
jgi:hypothetical protein